MNRVMVLLLLLVLLIPITAHADDTVAIRAYLVDQGYTNEQITYEQEMVKLNGRDFYGTRPKEDCKTYAKSSVLDELITDHKSGKYTVYMEAPIRMIK